MQTYELKKVDAATLEARVRWEIDSQRHRAWLARLLYDTIMHHKRKTATRFLKQDFDAARDRILPGSDMDKVMKRLGVERMWVMYSNDSWSGIETFEFDIQWDQLDPFAPVYNRGTGKVTTKNGLSIRRIPRQLPAIKEHMDREFLPYFNGLDVAKELEESLPGIPDAVERYNAALVNIVAASQFGGDHYPYSQAFPFASTRL